MSPRHGVRHSERRWYQRRSTPPPREPFWKDEHITRRITTARAVRLFVVAVVVAVLVLIGAVLFVVHEVSVARSEREAGHADRLKAESELKTQFMEGLAKLKAQEEAQFQQAICTFTDQFPSNQTPSLNVLRREYGCRPFQHAATTPSAAPKPAPKTGSHTHGAAPPAGSATTPRPHGSAIAEPAPHTSAGPQPRPPSRAPPATHPRPPPTTPPTTPRPTPTPTPPPILPVGGTLCRLLGICLTG